ncbi:TPA: DNA-binding protein [Escherichia coli]|nr:DNA-binding protein [Escherichia coli]HAW1812476.1 DNA-binding protein [Escherichia coli]
MTDKIKNRRKNKDGVKKAKYIFEDENREIKTWSRNGKIPLTLQKRLNEG